jgi:hypothetical protein
MNKAKKINRNRQMIAGVQKHYGPNDTILVDGVATKQTDVVATLQAPITASDATSAAEAAFHAAVAQEVAANATADTTFQGLKAYFLSINAKTPGVLADYGVEPVVKQVPTAAVKAAAATKRAETVAARGVVGKRKRAAIKAPAPSAAAPATAPVAAPAGTTGSGTPPKS